MVPQARISLHQICQQKCFRIPRMGVFEMRSAKKCGVLVRRSKRTYLCTKYGSKSVFVYLVWVCLKCAMPKMLCFGAVPKAHTPLRQICQQTCIWIPSMDVFEMHSAKKCALVAWGPKCAYLCTKYASNSVFGYLVWECLKCTTPKKSSSSEVAPQTSIPLHPIWLYIYMPYIYI